MLDELVGCIDDLKERISKYRNSINESETRTRMQLIDPLLRVLGWDVSDPQYVVPEYKVSDGWADYALLRDDGKPAAMVEAKKLDEFLKSTHRAQMLKYAIELGIPYTGLTNGNHWEIYNVFEPVPMEEKKILDVSILDKHSHEIALKLLLLWRCNLDSTNTVTANEPVLVDIQNSGPTPPPPPDPPSSNWKVLSDYEPPANTSAPIALRLWDNTERQVNHWYEVLTIVAEKLYEDSVLRVEHAPIQWSPKIYSIHTQPIHPTGKEFYSYKEIGNSVLFVNVNLNARQVRASTKNLLKKYKIGAEKIYLKESE
ncbi:MAG: type I restriction enzyme HsdR N-terminal domain-containing protein [Gemmatimonadetes bacterium]|nr:type I restriction enzyme HsdR N-terminal domain-containing protein [Gemmatimonadota bacterium]